MVKNKELTRQELLSTLTHNEWTDFEVKKAKSSVPKNVWETVSAFANTDEGYISEPRNPRIIKIFRILDLAEETGSGILKMNREWDKAGFIKPEFQTDQRKNYFQVTFNMMLKPIKYQPS